MFIDPKMQVPVDDLLKGMIVRSGNDATVALAEGVGGTVENFCPPDERAGQGLGHGRHALQNPEGLTEPGTPPRRKTCKLRWRSACCRTSRSTCTTTPPSQYRYEGTPASNSNNRNLLLFRDPSVDGLKTGHTAAAGYCLVATAKRELPSGGPASPALHCAGYGKRERTCQREPKLLNWGYTAFDAVKLFDAGQPVPRPSCGKASKASSRLAAPSPSSSRCPVVARAK